MSEGIKNPTISHLRETHFKYNDTGSLKLKGCKKIYHADTNQKKTGGGYVNI